MGSHIPTISPKGVQRPNGKNVKSVVAKARTRVADSIAVPPLPHQATNAWFLHVRMWWQVMHFCTIAFSFSLHSAWTLVFIKYYIHACLN